MKGDSSSTGGRKKTATRSSGSARKPSSGRYTIEVVRELTGIAPRTILLYHEACLVIAAGRPSGALRFDDEALRTLRRIDRLRTSYEMGLAGVKLTLALLAELERTRDDLRSRR
jgi:DNA-binding transcriptional MerR regulator